MECHVDMSLCFQQPSVKTQISHDGCMDVILHPAPSQRETGCISSNYTEGFNSQKLKSGDSLVPVTVFFSHLTAGLLGSSVNQDAPLEAKIT